MTTDDDRDNIERLTKDARAILKNEIRHLPLVPSVAIKLLKLTNDDRTKVGDLSKVIETEPILAAKVLRNVNSAAYYLPNKITSIKRAVNILGFSSVRRTALDLLFYNKLIKHRAKQKFNALFFWQHCLFVASLSRAIAHALQHPDPDLVYTAGLLHDIGKVVLETYGRLSYSDFMAAIENSTSSLIEEEQHFFGISHSEIGHLFCLEWQLPLAITAVVAAHHCPPIEASPYLEFNTEIAIVAFANYLAWMHGIGSVEVQNHPLLPPSVLKIIDTQKLDLEALLQLVDQDMQSTREFYGIQFPSVTKLRATLVTATINLGQLHSAGTHQVYASLTAPHQSLNPDDFLPGTLQALQRDFALDRIIMFYIDPKRRSLVAAYCWPETLSASELDGFEIQMNSVSGRFLACLRDKKAVIINNTSDYDKQLRQRFKVAEFMAVPVLRHNHLLGVLYADYSISKKSLQPQLLSAITPIAAELGIALFHAKQYKIEKKRAQIDPLSQLFNKRKIHQYLTEIFQSDESQRAHIAVGFVDIDKFKLFNDVFGHQAGDDVIKIVADILRNLSRPGDFIGRYGGEEYIFIIQNTNEMGAYAYAERLRTAIEQRGKIISQRFNNHLLTVSIGVAMYNSQYTSYAELIEAADQAMYRAKKAGRNRVIMLSRDQ